MSLSWVSKLPHPTADQMAALHSCIETKNADSVAYAFNLCLPGRVVKQDDHWMIDGHHASNQALAKFIQTQMRPYFNAAFARTQNQNQTMFEHLAYRILKRPEFMAAVIAAL